MVGMIEQGGELYLKPARERLRTCACRAVPGGGGTFT